MNRSEYIKPEFEIVHFDYTDIITNSVCPGGAGDCGPQDFIGLFLKPFEELLK